MCCRGKELPLSSPPQVHHLCGGNCQMAERQQIVMKQVWHVDFRPERQLQSSSGRSEPSILNTNRRLASWQARHVRSGKKTVSAQEMLSVSGRCPDMRQNQHKRWTHENRDQDCISSAALCLFWVHGRGARE